VFKLLIGLFGLIEFLYPERFLRVLTKYSYEYEGEAPVAKPWVVTAARIEGLVILGAVVYSALKADCNCGLLSRSDSTQTAEDDSDSGSNTVDRVD